MQSDPNDNHSEQPIYLRILEELQKISKKQVQMSEAIEKIKLTIRKRILDSDILEDFSYYETFSIETDDDDKFFDCSCPCEFYIIYN